MSEPSEGKRAGRPKNYEGPEDPVFEKFEKHLNKIVKQRRRGSDKRLFADIGDLTSPKFDKLKPHLKFLLDLAEVQPHWNFGGPFQVSVLQRWNKTAKFHDRNGSREWARGQIGCLWKMERALDALATDPSGWASMVEDVKEYPIPQRRSQVVQKPSQAELIFEADEVSPQPGRKKPLQSLEADEVSPADESGRKQPLEMPPWMLEDLENMMPQQTEAGDALVEETAGSSTPKHSSEAMAFSTFKEEAAAPQESDAGKAAPTGSGEKPSKRSAAMKRSKTRPMKRPASAESTSKKTKDPTVDDKEGGRRKRNDKDAENDGEEHDAECDGEDGEGGRRRKRKRKRRRKSEGRAE